MRVWERAVATGLGTGYFPVAPATFGSLLGFAFWFLIIPENTAVRASLIAALFFYGVYLCARLIPEWGDDPRRIVVDEICGMWLVLWLIPGSAWVAVGGFFVFRVFDVIKPPPIRGLESIPQGWGVMLDDTLAALYSAGFIRLLSLTGHLLR
ncbi:hypothetical protein AMJ40_03035 [candidate division TA06 bacterium DG_26]|uniref:YutG/PgpA domain-containing protein n=1 Tax=candidate division TA06 bacterium DG_26 TaxID=1703771 RepID=A0A0S7WJX4_UNCT6|nr:MAG: hypothetical protein AMJ40_03035 [candidate division TA06 bacterium DG_26]